MKLKYVTRKVIRYVVVFEADNVDEADDQRFNHEEWREEEVEEEDPPWREDCPEDEEADVFIIHGQAYPAWDREGIAKARAEKT